MPVNRDRGRDSGLLTIIGRGTGIGTGTVDREKDS